MNAAANDRDEVLEEGTLNMLDLLVVLAKRKILLLTLPLLFVALGAAYAFLSKPVFVAKTVVMPPQQQQSSAAAMLSQLGSLAGAAGGALGKTQNELYLAMLQSRVIGVALVNQFNLKTLYKAKTLTAALKKLDGRSEMVSGKDGLIVITVADESPQRAADIANAYVTELRRLMKTLAVTEAQQRRVFFEDQLRQAKDSLTEAELEMKALQEKTGIVQMEAQGKATIEALAQLRGQIAAKQVQLNAMSTFATGNNPDYQRVQSELAGMQAQLGQLTRGNDNGDGALIVKSKAPSLSLEYVRKFRNVKYQETLFEIIAKQYEIAHMDEAKQGALIQVIDPATPPERKAKPKRMLILLMSAIGGLFFSIVLAFVLESMKNLAQGPNAEKWRELRAALSFRKPKVV